MTENLIFLISFIAFFIIGFLLFKFTFKALKTLFKSDKMVQDDDSKNITVKILLFSIFFSLGMNLLLYGIYGLIFGVWAVIVLHLFIYTSIILLIAFSIGEIAFFSNATEELAIFPNHRLFNLLGAGLYKKTSSSAITAILLILLFYGAPFFILIFLNIDYINALLFTFLYIPIAMIGYFFALGVYKLLRPLLYFKRSKSPLILGALFLIVVFGFNIFMNIFEYYEYFPYLYLGVNAILLLTIILSSVAGSKHRPQSMVHIFKKRRRPFDYIYVSSIILVVGFYFIFSLTLLDPGLTNFREIFTTNITFLSNINLNLLFIFQLIFYITPVISIGLIFYNRHRDFDPGVKNYLIDSIKKRRKGLNYKFLNDRIILETIEELANDQVIEPRFIINLNHVLDHEDVGLRRKAILTFRKIMEIDKEKIPLVVPYFMRMLKRDKVWTVRLEIAESLSKIIKYIPNEIPIILDYLKKEAQDTNRYVRWGVIKVYESIITAELERFDELYGNILSAFEDKEWSVKKGALESLISLSKISAPIIPKILPPILNLLKKAEDEDLIKEIYHFITTVSGMEIDLGNLNNIISKLNSIVECVDEECKNTLVNNLKLMEKLKEQELEQTIVKKKIVDSFKDEKYKLRFD